MELQSSVEDKPRARRRPRRRATARTTENNRSPIGNILKIFSYSLNERKRLAYT